MIKSLLLIVLSIPCLFGAITVKHVDGTTTEYTEAQLQNAIDDPLTACGDIIEIDPGASRHLNGAYVLRGPSLDPSLGGPSVPPSYAKDCSSSGKYITIRSSKAYQLTPGKRVGAADAANLAFLGLLSSCTVIRTERAANYWRLQGLEIAAPTATCNTGGSALLMLTYQVATGSSGLTRSDHFPHHIIIDQCWIHGLDGYSVRDGVQPQGISIQIINSTIEDIKNSTAAGQEAHAIVEYGGLGPIRVVNNKLSASHINVLWGGAVSAMQGVRMEWIEFSNNWLYRPYKWIDWPGTVDPTPLSPCPVDADGRGATYHNTSAGTYWECQGAVPGTWTQLSDVTAYNALVNARQVAVGDKNIFEIKSASKVHFEGNLLDQAYSLNWQGQAGSCFLFNAVYGSDVQESHLLFENNICRHAPTGIGQGSDRSNNVAGEPWWWADHIWSSDEGHPAHDIIFRHNLFQRMGEDKITSPGFGSMANWAQSAFFSSAGFYNREGITLDHNTWQSEYTRGTGTSNSGLNVAFASPLNYDATRPALNQRITNSIFTAGKNPYWGVSTDLAGTWGPYAEIAANAVLDNLGIGPSGMTGFSRHCTPASAGCAYTTPTTAFPPNCLGCTYPAPSAAGFTNYPDDLTLQSTSPLKAAGIDGKDLGADLNTVGWATAGAEAGTMAPYLSMKIRAVIPAATSVQVRFSAIDLSSCTVEARVYGFPLSSPAATATDSTATLDRLVTLTGLTSNTKYGLKVTCAGTYYREDEFRTP